MTNERAAELVKAAFQAWECEYGSTSEDWSEEHEACQMAVAALKGLKGQKIVVAQIVLDEKRLQEICKKAAQNIYNKLEGEQYGQEN